jgi:DNA-binding Xre family transcriptional regulator
LNIKKALKVALAQKGMTYIELAEKMGVGKAMLYNLKGNVNTSTVQSMCDALGMKFSEFVALGEE